MKVEMSIIRENIVGGKTDIIIQGYKSDVLMIIDYIEKGIDETNENLKNKYDIL